MLPMPPPITQALLLINVAVYCLDFLLGGWLRANLSLHPAGHGFMPWQLVTYAFLHGDFGHLFFNMFGIWMFGSPLEERWSGKRYLHFYFASIMMAALTHLAINGIFGPLALALGASGGLFGLLLAYGMTFPTRVILLFFVLPVPAWLLVTGFGLIELYQGVFGSQEGIAHFAHLGGMLGGFLMIRYWRGQSPFGRR